ncbi:FecCD family ABC transporter permease [Candidatus Nitrospira neomarina]|uniref:Iron ABC transporter permease n=1 Tax=Candidatus Nitrospira neomarina TaxID=3020899 RepID=A0AA96GHU5_9BACT|nr:iron ABC transporter permease [Candidatus Nitrospira neomarina]WNM62724.1 iron ABC transporter permease [Candidatus Nitrospira neomarina]
MAKVPPFTISPPSKVSSEWDHRSPPLPFAISSLPTLTIRGWLVSVGISCVMAVVALLVCLGFGTEPIPFSRIWSILVGSLPGTGSTRAGTDPTTVILLQVRLPRLLLAFFVGGSLAMVGVALQALLRNPLADPFIIGISSGAALGAAIALLFGVGISVLSVSALPVCAFAGALLSLVIMYRISSVGFGFSIYTLLLAGVVLNAIFSAFIMFLTSVADPNRAFGMYAWLMGSLTGPDYSTLGVLGLYLGVGLVILATQAQSLNLLTLGEETARSLGVEVERVKKLVFVAAALLTGAVVSFSGIIGFVGLIVPHAVRLVLSADHRLLLPAAGFVGGMFLMLADTVARTALSPSEFPVGVVTALVGGPVFLYLLTTRSLRVGM